MDPEKKAVKWVFVLGGVLSGLGKGIVSASLGYLLKSRGLNVTIQKLDPYLNVDPGTMNPYQHGEVFILDDGAETDLDLGHYERFIDVNLGEKNTTSAGRVYWDVLERERRGDYLGETIQVIPHITDEIIRRIEGVNLDNQYDVVITEVGGTVGDIEGRPFMEAIRQFCLNVGRHDSLIIHTTLLPYLNAAGEMKTKPTQHSVMQLREIGLQPDLIICRTESSHHLDEKLKRKIGLFCNVRMNQVFESPDVDTIYEIPLVLHSQGFDNEVARKLDIQLELGDHNNIEYLEKFIDIYKHPSSSVKIAICGKYNGLHDAYKSILEAFIHAGVENNTQVDVKWVDTEVLEQRGKFHGEFKDVDGVLIPGGFGTRGIEGKIMCSKFAREKKIPFLGICLGLQCAVIDFARNVCGIQGAHSAEIDKNTTEPVVDLMDSQKKVRDKGATMRLGTYPCRLKEGSRSAIAYGELTIEERHRHRFEVNNQYKDIFQENGLELAGINTDLDLVEIIELPGHPWFVGVQFHPELKSRIVKAHPLFREFIAAAVEYTRAKN